MAATTGNFGTAELRTEAASNLSLCWEKAAGFDGVNGFVLGENQYLPDDLGLFWRPGVERGMGLTVGGARKGKGASTLIPALLSYGGSCVALDIKGELAWITAERRRSFGQRVAILDPFGEINRAFGKMAGATETITRYNPLSSLDPAALSFSDDIAGIVEALVWQQGQADPFFVGAARELLTGLIAAEVQLDPGFGSLPGVRDLLNLNEDVLAVRLQQLCDMPEIKDTLAERKLQSFTKVTKTNSSVIATCKEQLAFLDSEEMRRFLATDDKPFDFTLLSREKVTVYLVLAASHLETHARFLRLCISQGVRHVIRERPELDLPIAFFLDEMGTALGPMPILERAWGLASGYGLVLWGFVQDLNQLKRDYPQSWETFIANSAMIQVIGCRDTFTSNYFSDYLGKATIEVLQHSVSHSESFGENAGRSGGTGTSSGSSYSTGYSSGPNGGSQSSSSGTNYSTSQNSGWSTGTSKTTGLSKSVSRSEIGKPILDPDQLRRLPLDQELVIIPGQVPYQLMRFEYFTDGRFFGLYRPDPHYSLPTPSGSRPAKQRDPAIVAAERAAEAARLQAEVERRERLAAEAEAQRLQHERYLAAEQTKRETAGRLAAEKREKQQAKRRVWFGVFWVLCCLIFSSSVIWTPPVFRIAAYVLVSVGLVMAQRTTKGKTLASLLITVIGYVVLAQPIRILLAYTHIHTSDSSPRPAPPLPPSAERDLLNLPKAPAGVVTAVTKRAISQSQLSKTAGWVYTSRLYDLGVKSSSITEMNVVGIEDCDGGHDPWRNVSFRLRKTADGWTVIEMGGSANYTSRAELFAADTNYPKSMSVQTDPLPTKLER